MTFTQQQKNRKTATNTGFASGGVTCKLGALCFYSSSVLVDSLVLRNPPERKAPKRYQQGEEKDRDNENDRQKWFENEKCNDNERKKI